MIGLPLPLMRGRRQAAPGAEVQLVIAQFYALEGPSGLQNWDLDNVGITTEAGGLLVAIIAHNGAPTVSAVTWDQGGNNEALSLVDSIAHSASANTKCLVYALANPTPQTARFRCSWAGGTGSVGLLRLLYFRNASSTLLTGKAERSSQNNIESSLTTTINNALLFEAYVDSQTGSHTALPDTSGMTDVYNVLHPNGRHAMAVMDGGTAGQKIMRRTISSTPARVVQLMVGVQSA